VAEAQEEEPMVEAKFAFGEKFIAGPTVGEVATRVGQSLDRIAPLLHLSTSEFLDLLRVRDRGDRGLEFIVEEYFDAADWEAEVASNTSCHGR
jgi:hypothetical protein